MLKVIDKYSDFGEWDNSDQSHMFLKKMFPLLVILGWEIRQGGVESGGGVGFLLFCPQTGMELWTGMEEGLKISKGIGSPYPTSPNVAQGETGRQMKVTLVIGSGRRKCLDLSKSLVRDLLCADACP